MADAQGAVSSLPTSTASGTLDTTGQIIAGRAVQAKVGASCRSFVTVVCLVNYPANVIINAVINLRLLNAPRLSLLFLKS